MPNLNINKIQADVADGYKSRSARPAFYNQQLLATESADMTTLQIQDRNESLKIKKDKDQANDDTTNHILGTKESKMDIMYYLTVFYVCLVNGLANIFINNFVNISLNRFKHIGAKKKKTFHRQICGDLLFFLQNVVMVGLGLTIDVKPMNDPITAASVAGVIFGCHFLGLAIKVVYYKYFHIWKDLMPTGGLLPNGRPPMSIADS